MSTGTALTQLETMDSDWLQAVALPLDGSPCGEDPRYLDDFLAIKQEIDKLQGNDYPRMVELCRRMLAETSKDLRVAGYLLLASVYTDGLSGLLEAARAYRVIAQNFWQDCHPQKEGARISALRWLNNSKLDSYVRQHGSHAESDHLRELRELIDAVNRKAEEAFGEEAPRWSILDKWLNAELLKHQEKPAAAPPETLAPASAPKLAGALQPAPPQPPVTGPGSQPTAIDSERELVATTRAIRDYLLRNKDFLRAVGYTRALRWGSLALPPQRNGITRIPGPRPAAFNELKLLLDSGEPEALFTLCEKLFLEPGGHLALELQRHACTAARTMGREDLAVFIADQTASLVRRLPELLGLQFEDRHPFADMATREWIGSLLASPEQGHGAETQKDPWETDLGGLLDEARQLLQRKKLPAALGTLKLCPVHNEKQRIQVQLTMARLCLEGGRPEVAVPVLDELHDTVQAKSLDIWDPALAIEVWKQLLEANQALLPQAAARDKEALCARVAEIKALICRIDMEAAARLF